MRSHKSTAKHRSTTTKSSSLLSLPLQFAAGVGNFLHVFVFASAKNRAGVFVGGRDGHGILKHMAETLLRKHKFDVRSCCGERLQYFQGSCFDIAFARSLDADAFSSLKQSLTAELTNFDLPEPFLPDLYARLEIDVPHDDRELLLSVADVLGDQKVNLAYFRCDRLKCGRLATSSRKVKLSARLELPPGLDPLFLQQLLREACPEDATMKPLLILDNSPALLRTPLPANDHRIKALRN